MLELSLMHAGLALGLGWVAVPPLIDRVRLSRAKHRSLAGHARMAKRLARWMPAIRYEDTAFFASDNAPPQIVARRRAALDSLSARYRRQFERSLAISEQAQARIPDLAFTAAYRVPPQYAMLLRAMLPVPAFAQASRGVRIIDLDGNALFDLGGSYGVNLFGYDFYRECIAQGSERVAALGPVLGPLHPCVADVARRLSAISGLDTVSFHMSGTEAVMQAVRLARYHTRRRHLVRFAGAYHGWWEDVQPGPGNPLPPRETYTLAEMSAASLKVLRTRSDIACVLVNPLQAMHPNANPAADSGLLCARADAQFDRDAYARWLGELRQVCDERDIVLIFDEVFLGFRLAPGGAQQYFGVRADLVTYGKTLGGGLPVGVVCGRRDLMQRFRDDRPADICFARGTFNSHPYVMGAMQAFLDRLDTPEVQALYNGLEQVQAERVRRFNDRMQAENLPLRVSNMATVWTVGYNMASRYHWMLQYYLRLEGIALPWTGTGRLIFSLDFTEQDFDAVLKGFVRAGSAMRTDGWWWSDGSLSRRSIRRTVARELFGDLLRRALRRH